MIINHSNIEVGKTAMMHAVYFYYQLLEEGSFSSGQTAYWLYDEYTVWELLDIEVHEPPGTSLGIDQNFIREAALVYILCMLANMYEELEPNEFPTKHEKAYKVLEKFGLKLIPEIASVLKAISNSDSSQFKNTTSIIFNQYVRGRFERLLRLG